MFLSLVRKLSETYLGAKSFSLLLPTWFCFFYPWLLFVVVGILVTKEGEEGGLCDFVRFWIFVCKSFVMFCVFWVWLLAGGDCSICVCLCVWCSGFEKRFGSES
jgi:hypothetical protein